MSLLQFALFIKRQGILMSVFGVFYIFYSVVLHYDLFFYLDILGSICILYNVDKNVFLCYCITSMVRVP